MRRVDNIKKATQANGDKVEEQTKNLERLLDDFKQNLSQKKEFSKSTHWHSGRTGPIKNYVQSTLTPNISNIKNFTKIKILSTRVNESPRSDKFSESSGYKIKFETSKRIPNACGQCDKVTAAVACQECGESFCAKCFAYFHMKGALRKHHSLLLTSQTMLKSPEDVTGINQNNSVSSLSSTSEGCQTPKNNHFPNSNDSQVGPNEPFVNVEDYKDYRIKINKDPITVECCGTDPISQETKKTPKINFIHSLSYAEQLLIKKNRLNKLLSAESFFKISKFRSSEISNSYTDLSNEEEEKEKKAQDWDEIETPNIYAMYELSQFSMNPHSDQYLKVEYGQQDIPRIYTTSPESEVSAKYESEFITNLHGHPNMQLSNYKDEVTQIEFPESLAGDIPVPESEDAWQLNNDEETDAKVTLKIIQAQLEQISAVNDLVEISDEEI